MFQNKDTIRCQKGFQGGFCLPKYRIGDVLQVFQGIGRVGKDDVVLLFALLAELESIGMERNPCGVFQLFGQPLKELPVLEIFLHTYHPAASSANQFQTDAASAGKQVKSLGTVILKVDVVVFENVEKPFLCEVGRGARLEMGWSGEVAAFVFSSDDSHRSEAADEKRLHIVGDGCIASGDAVPKVVSMVNDAYVFLKILNPADQFFLFPRVANNHEFVIELTEIQLL